MDERQRRRILAELHPDLQGAVDAIERVLGINALACDRPLRALLQEAALSDLYDHYRAEGRSSLAAYMMAGDAVGLSPAASRSRYYRAITPQADAA